MEWMINQLVRSTSNHKNNNIKNVVTLLLEIAWDRHVNVKEREVQIDALHQQLKTM